MENKIVKLRGIQRQVAMHMVKSKSEIPHVTTIREIRMDHVLNLRKHLKENHPEDKFSVMSFVIQAVINGLNQYPIINANLQEDEITYHEDINIGVAITVGDNLLVPVLKHLQDMDFYEVNEAYNQSVIRSLDKKLTPDDFADGTFTISNSGALGGEIFTPIINYPQSAILGIGRIKEKPAVDPDGSIIPLPMMYLCLSYDHRIINGSQAVGFLGEIEAYLQTDELR